MFTKATVVGRIVVDPELKEAGGSPVVNFTLASNRKFKGEDVVDYYDFVAWRDLATNFAAYKNKGDLVLVEGRLEQSKWEQEGQKRSKVQIVASNIVFLPSKNDDKNGGDSTPNVAKAAADDNFDDIPF